MTIKSGCSNNNPNVWFAEFSGMQTGPGVLGATGSSPNQASSTTVTSPSVTNSISGLQGGRPFTAFSTADGRTMAYYLPTSTGSCGAVWTQSSAGTYSTVSAVFKPR